MIKFNYFGKYELTIVLIFITITSNELNANQSTINLHEKLNNSSELNTEKNISDDLDILANKYNNLFKTLNEIKNK